MSSTSFSQQLRAVAAVLLVFVLGVLSGVLGGVRLTQWKIRSFVEQGPEGVSAALGERIAHKIGLDSNQREKLTAILSEKTRDIQTVRSKMQPEITAIVLSGESEIRAILNPEQAARFTRMTAPLIERWLPLHHNQPSSGATP